MSEGWLKNSSSLKTYLHMNDEKSNNKNYKITRHVNLTKFLVVEF